MSIAAAEQQLFRRVGVVYNPSKNKKALDRAIGALKSHGFELEVIATKNFADVGVQVNAVISKGKIQLLLIGGGDGTVLAGINGLPSFNTPVGILPLGCSNDFCHALGIHHIDDAIAAIIRGQTIQADLCMATYKNAAGTGQSTYFCSTAGIGFIPGIFKIENKRMVIFLKKALKDAIWPILAFYKIVFIRDIPMQLAVNGQVVYAQKTRLLEVSKVQKAGGVPFTPDAALGNRSLDFWFAREMSFSKFLRSVIIKVTTPTFRVLKQVTYFSLGPMRSQDSAPVREIHIKTSEPMPLHLNGEYMGECREVGFSICNTHQLTVICHAP